MQTMDKIIQPKILKFQAQHNITLSTKFNPEEVLEQIRKTIEGKQINFVQFG